MSATTEYPAGFNTIAPNNSAYNRYNSSSKINYTKTGGAVRVSQEWDNGQELGAQVFASQNNIQISGIVIYKLLSPMALVGQFTQARHLFLLIQLVIQLPILSKTYTHGNTTSVLVLIDCKSWAKGAPLWSMQREPRF
ncbi:hypothetical protein [Polynucleobacter necessarius]|uniref:hypothetical protein n=1 Tax=Polynucleobacter necessarius TaxID=576610 RepID=UPI001E2BAF3D|nr:hypothetical protein [Polynucleobacter necessarius]